MSGDLNFIYTLSKIAEDVGGDWKDKVLVDNDTNDVLVEAYNDGVRAMARQATFYIKAILDAKGLEMDVKRDGNKIAIEKVGEQDGN